MRTGVALMAACALIGGARADEGVDKRSYPASLIERPMTLPTYMFQPQFELDLSNLAPDAGRVFPDQQGLALGIGIDVGLHRRVQMGIYFVAPMVPFRDFGVFDANLQVNLIRRALSLRFDFGVERADLRLSFFGPNTGHGDNALIGVGVPYKIKLHRLVAIVGGGTRARDFGLPWASNLSGGDGAFGGSAYSSDILMLSIADFNGQPVSLVGSFHLPLGVLFQPISWLAFAVRTGYRLAFVHVPSRFGPTRDDTTHLMPLALDLTFSTRHFDAGFTATILGALSTQTSLPTMTPGVPAGQNWAQVQRYDFWVCGRF